MGECRSIDAVRLRQRGRDGVAAAARGRHPERHERNADGTYGSSGLKFDDPNGDLTIGRLQNVIINETDCTPNRVFTGYVIEARPSRGPYKQGVGRVWNVDVGDLNVLSHLQAFHTSDAKRPQETGSARRDWLLGTTQARYFHDAGQADDFTGLFDEADYRGQYPDDVLNDISGPIGRIFFLYWTNTSTQVGLFWAGATDGLSTSTLSISNVLADVNNTTVFGPAPDAELTIDMSEVYDEVILNWAGGQVFASDYDGRMPYSEHRTGVFDDATGRASRDRPGRGPAPPRPLFGRCRVDHLHRPAPRGQGQPDRRGDARPGQVQPPAGLHDLHEPPRRAANRQPRARHQPALRRHPEAAGTPALPLKTGTFTRAQTVMSSAPTLVTVDECHELWRGTSRPTPAVARPRRRDDRLPVCHGLAAGQGRWRPDLDRELHRDGPDDRRVHALLGHRLR
jgi:hypothetical protein